MPTVNQMIDKRNLVRQSDAHPDVVTNDFVGLELELERARPLGRQFGDSRHWRVDGDGSLRDEGYEFILSKPKQGQGLIDALDELQGNVVALERDSLPNASIYCSTHVHINFLDKTTDDIIKFLSVYLLVEDGLARYCGANRENNLFCLTASNAEFQTGVFKRMHQEKSLDTIRGLGDRHLKYSALNIACLLRFGTLESRLGNGMYNKDEILKWVNILLSIKKYSEALDTPMDVLQEFSIRQPDGFLEDVFGQYNAELKEFFNLDEMYEGVDRVQYILS